MLIATFVLIAYLLIGIGLGLLLADPDDWVLVFGFTIAWALLLPVLLVFIAGLVANVRLQRTSEQPE